MNRLDRSWTKWTDCRNSLIWTGIKDFGTLDLLDSSVFARIDVFCMEGAFSFLIEIGSTFSIDENFFGPKAISSVSPCYKEDGLGLWNPWNPVDPTAFWWNVLDYSYNPVQPHDCSRQWGEPWLRIFKLEFSDSVLVHTETTTKRTELVIQDQKNRRPKEEQTEITWTKKDQ